LQQLHTQRDRQTTDSCHVQVLERLSAADTRLVFVGDSLLHQLWVRLIALMREQRRPVDFRVFTHARYSVSSQ